MTFRVTGVNIAINLDEADDPYLLWQLHEEDGETIEAMFSADEVMGMFPYIIESLVRTRTLVEMMTLWPDRRKEIVQNALFRWAGVIEDGDDGT